MPKVSVVTPIYNAAKYLGRSISSVLNQTYRNLELILINDGSTDNSLEICYRFAKFDPRISVVDIPNGGVSNARNVGIQNSNGEYLHFVDSDDSIDSTAIEYMIEKIEFYSADIVLCGMKVISDNELSDVLSIHGYGTECVFMRENFIKSLPRLIFETSIMEGIHSKLYKKSIVDKNKIIFPTFTSYGEDFYFNIDYYFNVECVVFVSIAFHNYHLVNKDSLSMKYISDYFENQSKLIYALEERIAKEDMLTEEGREYLKSYNTSQIISCLRMLVHDNCNLSLSQKKALIVRIMNSELTQINFEGPKFLSPDIEPLLIAALRCDVETMTNEMEKVFAEPEHDQEYAEQRKNQMLAKLQCCNVNDYIE